MHLIKDENGNILPHGHEHSHEHEGKADHDHVGEQHSHVYDQHDQKHHAHCHGGCDSCSDGCDPKKEAQALLTYMLQHNEHHAAELDQMAANLEKLGFADSAKQIREGVTDFQKGNLRLSLALTLMKEQA